MDRYLLTLTLSIVYNHVCSAYPELVIEKIDATMYAVHGREDDKLCPKCFVQSRRSDLGLLNSHVRLAAANYLQGGLRNGY
ncbi:hypothetical protein F4818DRAFT_403156 [Hypoxylon cercidicola]|nr:hypothetical protein F4818DRAFT_403156 [Hypoxylon cercidicola]